MTSKCLECGEEILGEPVLINQINGVDYCVHDECLIIYQNGAAEAQRDARREEYYDNKQRL